MTKPLGALNVVMWGNKPFPETTYFDSAPHSSKVVVKGPDHGPIDLFFSPDMFETVGTIIKEHGHLFGIKGTRTTTRRGRVKCVVLTVNKSAEGSKEALCQLFEVTERQAD